MGDADWDGSLHYFPEPAELASFEPEWPYDQMDVVPVFPPCSLPFQPVLPLTPPNSDAHPSPQPSGVGCEPIDAPPRDANNPDTVSVSVSTAFHLDARLLPIPPDVVLVAHDHVLFYVHVTKLLSKSRNSFNELLSPKLDVPLPLGAFVSVPEHSSVLNIVLHSVYDLSCAHYHPLLATLGAAVDAMAEYGMAPKDHILPSKPLFSLILNQAPIYPILAYSIAASHDMMDMAVPVSSHTLSLQLQSVSTEDAVKIGPIYLRRLFFLHLGRLEALRTLLLPPPHPHPSTSTCDFADQRRLTRAWTLASAHLAWEARPDLSASTIEATLYPLGEHLVCRLCKQNLAERVKQLIVRWSMVKRSI